MGTPSKPTLGAVEPSPVAAIVPESIAMLRGRHFLAYPGFQMKREVVVITGASAGLGRAIAREFGRHGASVGLISRNQPRLEAAKHEIEQLGGHALVVVADVANSDAVESAVQKIETDFGPIDVWVNNAMASVFSPIEDMQAEEYKRITEVTYLGTVYGTLSVLKRMQTRDRGVIVQVGSALAYRSIPLQSAYCAAKHAIAGFTDSLRCELIHQKSRIRVTTVHMPALNTPQFGWVKSRLPRKAQPVPPIFQPEVGARAVYWAAHHNRRELLVGSSTVVAVIGQKIVPGLLDKYLGKTGYASQQYDGPEDPNRPTNLWESVPGDFAAHGVFNERAHSWSPEVWMDTNRGWLVMIPVAAAGVAAVIVAGVTGRFLYRTLRGRKQQLKRNFGFLKKIA